MGWLKIMRGRDGRRKPSWRAEAAQDRRWREMHAVAQALRDSRRPQHALWERIVASLEDRDFVAIGAADGLLAEAPPEALAGHADRLAAFLRRYRQADAYGPSITASVLIALAGLGDRRALPLLTARLADHSHHFIHEEFAPALARLPVQELLPRVRTRLRLAPGHYGHATAVALLGLWGPAAAPAVPEVVPLLDGGYARAACEVLGRIGPGAVAAADVLAGHARGHTRPGLPVPPGAPNPWHGRQSAAWAHWQVTGDDGLALEVCGSFARKGLGGPVLRYVGDLCPAAAAYVDDVRALLDAPGAWTRVEAAHALWRITGDPGPSVPVLVRELAPLREASLTDPAEAAVRHLGEIGAPAAAAAPLLRELYADGRRATHRSGRRILCDERLRRSLETALGGIEKNGERADRTT
ncbi:hypothetical protein ABT084_35365 [Streptomyces sp. NPDC002138]|uniref:hypothetical protein n=1 Tax=Streptomyces sp. NPDC002138 TaxID=3154410 RepID=UPI00331BA131